MTGDDVERLYLDVLRDVREMVTIPLAVKLSPYFSSMAHMAQRLARSGADGLVLFNRFYQPDFDLENLEVGPHLVLSDSDELRLPLRWIAILYGRVHADFAAHQRRPHAPRRPQGRDGRRRRDHAGLGAAEERHLAHHRHPRGHQGAG